MTSDEAIEKFGVPSRAEDRAEIQCLLKDEIERELSEEGDQELIRALCVQLFSIGAVEDSLFIWRAKNCNFDTMCGLDIQLLCGAGLLATKTFLNEAATPEATEAFSYLSKCDQAGDFTDWSPSKWITYYRSYFNLDSECRG